MKKRTFLMALLISLLIVTQALFADDVEFDDPGEDSFTTGFSEEGDLEFDSDGFEGDTLESGFAIDTEGESKNENPSIFEALLAPARFTLKHEVSFKTESPRQIMMNRSSVRLEYSGFFQKYFFLQLDCKLNGYWGNDHRAKAEDKSLLMETKTREAFLQASIGNTSIKVGRQILIWGESDGGAITDVISPRDYSELFFISLEESRIGQEILLVDQFSDWGDVSLFYIPNPGFNAYPKEDTAYYYDPFNGQAVYRDATSDGSIEEFGMRCKKTFGKSDISVMAASLMENDKAFELAGYTSGGEMILVKHKERYSMKGFAANFVKGNFLYKGELALKSPRSFNNASYQIVKRDVLDAALGLEYSSGGSTTIGLEMVNSHIYKWSEELIGTDENSRSIVFVLNRTFLNDTLSVDWMSNYTFPREAWFHSLRSSYKWSDDLTLELEGFYPVVSDETHDYWVYREQKQLAFKAQYQF